MIKLYDLVLSGNCYKIRLLLSLLKVEHELVPVDFMAGEHKSPEFRQLNPLGEIPVLVDGELVLRDSQAILVYLARKYGGETWLPMDPAGMGQVMQWLSIASHEIAQGPNSARLNQKFGYDIDLQMAQQKAHTIIQFFDEHLSKQHWLALGQPTIADLACFPYIALAPEGGVELDTYPAVNQWIERIKEIQGFVSMPGI
ncbi:MAG: glutathione S-transferase [Cyanothece sp. SIO1E1]|nr:glutathione S-transferase [Cyanothece sp. SIO1E1]